MINKINILKQNIKYKKITVLGSGISGQGAAILGNYLGAYILLSDINKPKKINSKILRKNITTEFNGHSKKVLESDLIILSPGINFKSIELANEINLHEVTEHTFGGGFNNINQLTHSISAASDEGIFYIENPL